MMDTSRPNLIQRQDLKIALTTGLNRTCSISHAISKPRSPRRLFGIGSRGEPWHPRGCRGLSRARHRGVRAAVCHLTHYRSTTCSSGACRHCRDGCQSQPAGELKRSDGRHGNVQGCGDIMIGGTLVFPRRICVASDQIFILRAGRTGLQIASISAARWRGTSRMISE